MENVGELKTQANHLRKAGKYSEALPLYIELWEKNSDEFDGAGLINCLRKLERFDEAHRVAEKLGQVKLRIEWAKNEVIWAHIQALLLNPRVEHDLAHVLPTANEILKFRPEGVALKITVFQVLKAAKAQSNWEVAEEWTSKLDPDKLDVMPMISDSGKEGWSDRALWYNYRIKALLENKKTDEAINLSSIAIDLFGRQKKYFYRLKALALAQSGKYEEAKRIYEKICSSPKADWWLLSEYAQVVAQLGDKERALELMYRAMSNAQKIETTVNLLFNIGKLCLEAKEYETARDHLILCKLARDREGWSIPFQLQHAIEQVRKYVSPDGSAVTLKEAFIRCKKYWPEHLQRRKREGDRPKVKRNVRKDLVGIISLGPPDRKFCFIKTTQNQSIFCSKSDIPKDTKDGSKMSFDAYPSFDKKKNRESWIARNIRS